MSSLVKITKEQGLAIREAYTSKNGGCGMTTLAARYNVDVSLIYRVLKGEHSSVRGMPDIAGTRGSSFTRRRSSLYR